MKVLLTGAAGSLGSKIARKLLLEGNVVIGVDVLNSETTSVDEKKVKVKNLQKVAEQESTEFRFYRTDINSPKLLDIFTSNKPDKVIHAAARVQDRESVFHTKEFLTANVLGTANLLDCVRETKSIQNIVFISTRSVVGSARDALHVMKGNEVERPYNPYGVSKGAAEKLFYAFFQNFGTPTTVMRLNPQVCDRRDMMPRILIDSIVNGQTIVRFGDGSATRDWLHIEDTVDAIMLALEKPLGYEVFLLGTGISTTLDELVAITENILGKQGKYKTIPNPPGDVVFGGVSNSKKAFKVFGWKSRFTLEEAIKGLYHELRAMARS